MEAATEAIDSLTTLAAKVLFGAALVLAGVTALRGAWGNWRRQDDSRKSAPPSVEPKASKNEDAGEEDEVEDAAGK